LKTRAFTLGHCLQHPGRESVARCPECRESFCRECITEHAGRVICAPCLRRLLVVRLPVKRRWLGWRPPVEVAAGWFVAWLLFYSLGWVLLQIPAEWHEGTPVLKILAP